MVPSCCSLGARGGTPGKDRARPAAVAPAGLMITTLTWMASTSTFSVDSLLWSPGPGWARGWSSSASRPVEAAVPGSGVSVLDWPIR